VKDPIFDKGDTGQIAEAFIARDPVEKLRKDHFPVPDNGNGAGEQAQYLLRHDPERRPSHDYRGAGPFADNIHDTEQIVHEEDRTPHIVIVDVAHREADHIGFAASQGQFDFRQGVPGEHQIQEKYGVSRAFRGVRDYTHAYGHHGHGEVVSVSAD
jgi:hypothetical protein